MRRTPTVISVGRLMEFLTILGPHVQVTVKPAVRGKARTGGGRMFVVVYAGPPVS
jgi:hypothetical protein